MKRPNRKYMLTIAIGGDEYEDLRYALKELMEHMPPDFPADQLTTGGISAGNASSFSWQVDVDPDMTHERYFVELKAALAWEREQKANEDDVNE